MHSVPRRKKREGRGGERKEGREGRTAMGFAKLISPKKVRGQPKVKVVFMLISNTHT